MSSESSTNKIGQIVLFNINKDVKKFLKQDLKSLNIEVVDFDLIQEAVDFCKQTSVDVVLADFNNDKIILVDFFKELKENFPSINRFMLCEVEDHDSATNLLLRGIITKYFEKPFGVAALTKKIIHILKGKKLITEKSLLKLIHSIGELPAFQSTYSDFLEAIEKDKTIKEIADLLSRDISVSTKILQIANSAFYRISKIGSIERACIYLGLEKIKNIIFIVSLSSIRKLDREQMKHLERIITHSLKVNQHFQRFYKLETKKHIPELYSSVGITHDIGKIIMLQYLPKRFLEVINYQKKNPDVGFYRSELEMGFAGNTHAEIGAYFLDLWNFPEVNVSTALYHHTPELVDEDEVELQDVFSFANEFTKQV